MFLETIRQLLHPSSPILDDKVEFVHNSRTTMATDFAMPVQQFTASPSQYSLFNNASQQISPITPNSSSPTSQTSPRNGLPPLSTHTRQLRPPKSPLYVPAVLRPTDPPRRAAKASPLTPPQSMHNSLEDLDNSRTLSRRSTGDSGKFGLGAITEAEWSSEGLGQVTALPTRDHWKPDSDTDVCDETTCTRHFSFYNRRHHCRRCGNIFCDQHSVWAIPLDQDANYHPRGTRSRACEHCFFDYRAWHLARSSRSNSESSEPTTPTTPTVNCGRRSSIAAVFGQKNNGTPESLGASVPRDWNWSTF